MSDDALLYRLAKLITPLMEFLQVIKLLINHKEEMKIIFVHCDFSWKHIFYYKGRDRETESDCRETRGCFIQTSVIK